ncbi:TlpA family protein disulfide reductase [Polaribacter pacificus]|uniref:TlpA family protein disulfide reductase n=1 Tax=Polaribacter pacificus TaxID=1775173 RepID=UPI00166E6327|nr:TlpA disulfide reductase family protein [Polaribacter pacificus]
MFKKICTLLFLCLAFSCKKPTEFSEAALQSKFYTLKQAKVRFETILNDYKGQKILIDVWASWCPDCVVSFPELKTFQKDNPELGYVFLSTDRNYASWKQAIERYQLSGDHYFMEAGLDSPFGDFLNSNWIPRYLLVDEQGSISVFKATKLKDAEITKALKK